MIGKHFLIWLMIMFFTPLVLPMLLSPKTISSSIQRDYQEAIATFGNKDALDHELIAFYRDNLAVVARVVDEFRDNGDDSDKFRRSGDHIGEAIADIPGDWAASVKLQAYNLALRTVIISLYGSWFLAPIAMGFVAGVLGRRLKADTFSPPIPPLYNTSAHMLLALIGFLLLWLVCPLPLPLSIIPTVLVSASILISLAVTHYPNY
ncbi:DUF4400 domain-containing protein [Methylobacter sp. BlB1]|jgi:hypothetical protein|uniref:DUF4400 domain-containing protein n=1 Tax=Methylobacter sp. BlB1 TaxID=2785914 RepID=UPI001894CF7C|nr:DUF4400 domain-containing protein [Methylobacter sp. BlB1]MBF6650652.1 DUF4400 domain-containing protein [Methylobacter sp. BlB1]